jgi:hypothetical protein
LLFKNVPTYLQNFSRSGESASGSDENFAEEKTEVLQPASLEPSAPDDPLFHVLVEKKEPDEEDETVEKRYAYGSGA